MSIGHNKYFRSFSLWFGKWFVPIIDSLGCCMLIKLLPLWDALVKNVVESIQHLILLEAYSKNLRSKLHTCNANTYCNQECLRNNVTPNYATRLYKFYSHGCSSHVMYAHITIQIVMFEISVLYKLQICIPFLC